MTSDPQHYPADFEELVERSIEDRIDEEERLRLEEIVIGNESARRRYLALVRVHATLAANADALPRILADDETLDAPAPPSRRLLSFPAALAAAAVLALAFALLFFRSSAPAPVATLVEATDCRWAGSGLPTVEGASLVPGTLNLVEGLAILRFESGAVLTLEAPVSVEIVSAMNCRLVEGSIVADVPESAHGFTIDTAEMEVIDLGTRFGVTTSRFGNSQVLVFEGEVEVNRGDESPARLTTGKGMHIGHEPPLAGQEVSRQSTPEVAEDGWTAIPTSFGRGKDAYVRRGNSHGPTGAHPLIMVKHTDLAPTNERRAFLTFDLSAVPDGAVSAAELVLDVEASGLGFSALVPDSRFAIYGLLDDDLDSWEESELLWEEAPASIETGLLETSVRKLGEFVIRRGAAAAQVEIATPELARFVREDANGLATLIIVRETGETDSQGLVHAFASKEHPQAHPPTLRLKID